MTCPWDRVAGLVLAGGASVRMGTPKQLLPFAGKTLLEQVIEEALASRLGHIVLVLGHEAPTILERLHHLTPCPRLTCVTNPHHRRGLSSSILTGLAGLTPEVDSIMVLLGDMPGVTRGVIDRLMEGCLESGLPLGALRVQGRRVHPVVIGRPLFRELMGMTGDVGARGLFERYPERICWVEPDTPFDARDIDTPEEYRALLAEGCRCDKER